MKMKVGAFNSAVRIRNISYGIIAACFMSSCTQTTEVNGLVQLANIPSPVTITYHCSNLDEYDSILTCETATAANCVSDSQYYPDGTQSACFKPVDGSQGCLVNRQLVINDSNPNHTHWLYTSYGQIVFEPNLNGFYDYRSLVDCSSQLCACDPNLVNVPGGIYQTFGAGTVYDFLAPADATTNYNIDGYATMDTGTGIASIANTSTGIAGVTNLVNYTVSAPVDYTPDSSGNVHFTADNPINGGVVITLRFNGTTDTIDSVRSAWNTANPHNKVSYVIVGGGYTGATVLSNQYIAVANTTRNPGLDSTWTPEYGALVGYWPMDANDTASSNPADILGVLGGDMYLRSAPGNISNISSVSKTGVGPHSLHVNPYDMVYFDSPIAAAQLNTVFSVNFWLKIDPAPDLTHLPVNVTTTSYKATLDPCGGHNTTIGDGNFQIYIGTNNGGCKLTFSLNGRTVSYSLVGVTAAGWDWHMVTFTFDCFNLQLYINNVLVGTTAGALGCLSAPSFANGSTSTFSFGDASEGNRLNGYFQDFAIFNTALNAGHISSLWNGGGGANLSTLISSTAGDSFNPSQIGAYWDMESQGTDGSLPTNSTVVANNGGSQQLTAHTVGTVTSQTPIAGQVGNGVLTQFSDNSYYSATVGQSLSTFTVNFWIFPKSFTCQNNSDMIGDAWGSFLFKANSDCSVTVGTDSTAAGDITTSANILEAETGTFDWQMYTFTYNGSYGTLYKNGVFIATKAMPTPATFNNFNIGNGLHGVNGGAVDGEIDEVALWSVSLNDTEISTIYQRQKQKTKYYQTLSPLVGDSTGRMGIRFQSLEWWTDMPYGKEIFTLPPLAPVSDPATEYSAGGTEYGDINFSNGGIHYSPQLNLVHLWHFNDLSGTQGIKDSIATNPLSLTLSTPTAVKFPIPGAPSTAIFNTALGFRGNGYLYAIDSNGTMNAGADDRTVAGWIRTSTADNAAVFEMGPNDNSADNFLLIGIVKDDNGRGHVFFRVKDDGLSNYPVSNNNPTTLASGNDNTVITDGLWHHVAVTYRHADTTARLYVDGIPIGAGMSVTLTTTGSSQINFGSFPGVFSNNFVGDLDEWAFWNRPLSGSDINVNGNPNDEIMQLYQRGTNRVKVQLQSCKDPTTDCLTPFWLGPDATSNTTYSELNNFFTNSSTLSSTHPFFDLTSLAGQPATNPYYQYKVTYEVDNNGAVATPLPAAPKISINPQTYFSGFGTITSTHFNAGSGDALTRFNYAGNLAAFGEKLGPNGCSAGVVYQLSCTDPADGVKNFTGDWIYWNGTQWVSAGNDLTTATSSLDPTKANSASVINSAISDPTFLNLGINPVPNRQACSGNHVYWRAFLQSDGGPCDLDSVQYLSQ